MSLQEQITWVMEHGQLTLSDVSRWLHVPIPTVRSWHVNGRTPRNRRIKVVETRLDKLRTYILEHGAFVPEDLSEHNRPEFIKAKANEICGGISKKNFAKPRKLLRSSVLQN